MIENVVTFVVAVFGGSLLGWMFGEASSKEKVRG